MSKLKDKIAIVTGASKGIGASIARHLANEGAAVVVNYASSKQDAERVVADITRGGGRAIAVQGNVARQADVDRLFAETKTAFGRLDILVNNAGVYEFAPLEQVTEESFRKQFDTNVLGVLLASQAAVSAVYSATKAAVDAVTKALAKELGARNIRVNAINPGTVETEGVHAAGFIGSDFMKDAIAKTPLGRIGQPQDIAPVAVFLASSDGAWVTGETLAVSGGLR